MTDSIVPDVPRSKRALLACVAAIIVLTALDLGSKQWALGELSRERPTASEEVCVADERGYIRYQRIVGAPKVWVDGMLEMRYAENCGAAFGFLRDFPLRRYIFYPAALFAILLLPYMFLRGRGGRWFALSVPFIVAGAIGNLHDRIAHGYVVDFIRFYLRDGFWFLDPGWEYPTFNVADIHITVGVIMILIDGFAEGRRERAARGVDDAGAAHAEETPGVGTETVNEAQGTGTGTELA